MTEFTLFAYSLLVSFVLTSVSRNQKLARSGPPVLTHVAWGLMSFSAALFVLLTAYAVAIALGWARL